MDTIDILPWDKSFNTNLESIDIEHRKLVDIINSLATQFALSPSSVNIDTVFDELINYTHYHFQSEEEIWSQYLDKESFDNHHQTHTTFVDELKKIIQSKENVSIEEVAESTLGFLVQEQKELNLVEKLYYH